MRSFARAGRLGQVYPAPFDVHLPSGDIVQPDLIFVAVRNAHIVKDWIFGIPDLLVEVVSQESPERDRIVKRDLYARNGVPEYWLVQDDPPGIEVFRHAKGRYFPAGCFPETEIATSPMFPGLTLPVREMLA